MSCSRRRRSRGAPSRKPCPARGGGAGGVCSSASITTMAGSARMALSRSLLIYCPLQKKQWLLPSYIVEIVQVPWW